MRTLKQILAMAAFLAAIGSVFSGIVHIGVHYWEESSASPSESSHTQDNHSAVCQQKGVHFHEVNEKDCPVEWVSVGLCVEPIVFSAVINTESPYLEGQKAGSLCALLAREIGNERHLRGPPKTA